MFKRILAALICATAAAASLTSCGKEISYSSNSETSQSAGENETAEVMNFTAPQKGDTIIEMNIKDYGTVKIRLFPEYAEKGVENFVELAKKGYYDGLTFHRVIKDFMIQGGDPLGNGTGGESFWGGKFDGGTDPHLIHAAGALAYANSGSTATDGSQFYIVTGSEYDAESLSSMGISGPALDVYTKTGGAPWLDGSYTVFGQVFDGLDVIFNIQHVATGSNDMPTTPVIIESIKVSEYNGEDLKWYLSDYNYQPPTEAPIENVDLNNFTAPEEGEKVVDIKIKDRGDVMVKLFPEYAEKGVDNFLQLAESGYYDGLTFHRVIKDFMIQGGDPNGDGTGGESVWGGEFDGGTDPHLCHAAGALAYANSGGTATDGSQFYIVTGEKYTSDDFEKLAANGYKFSENAQKIYSEVGGAPWLDGSYTLFGQVFDGLDIVFEAQNVDTDSADKPVDDLIIESVKVVDYDGRAPRWYISDYSTADSEAETTENTEETEAAESEETTAAESETPEAETTAAAE